MRNIFLLGLFVLVTFAVDARGADFISVPGGSYKPLLGKGKTVPVAGFLIEENPVRNQDFLQFVKADLRWTKSKAKVIFIDQSYLKNWQGDLDLGVLAPADSPVVYVSWFAAKAYCEWKDARLPSVDEWEYLAQFGPVDSKEDVRKTILEWYSKITPDKIPAVKTTFKNKFGVWDIHGLIWEWTMDFNTTFVTGESRGDTALEKAMFCGSGAVGAVDPSDYAGFMRFGFRSSLKANYTVGNLGFRCVKEGHK